MILFYNIRLKQGPTDIDQDRVKVEVADGETKLTLKDVNIHDAGLYYCFANNSQGTVKSCASLTVRGNIFILIIYRLGVS